MCRNARIPMVMLGHIRLQLRFLIPLAATMVLAAYVALPLIDKVTLRWFTRDIAARGALVANALHDSTLDALASHDKRRLTVLFDRTAQDKRVFGIGLCGADEALLVRSSAFPPGLACSDARKTARRADPRMELRGGAVLVTRHSLASANSPATASPSLDAGAELILLHDLSFIERRSQDTRHYLIVFLAILGLMVAAITMLVAQLSLRGWIAGARALLRGDAGLAGGATASELVPFADELRSRLRCLEDEYRRSRGPWTTPHCLRRWTISSSTGPSRARRS